MKSIVLFVSLLLVSCDYVESLTDESDNTISNYYFLLDGTVFKKNEEYLFQDFINIFEKQYLKISELSNVYCLMLSENTQQQMLFYHTSYPQYTERDWEKIHKDNLNKSFLNIKKYFRNHWEKMHYDSAIVKQLNSCIISSLYNLSKLTSKAKQNDSSAINKVYIYSDLMEACREWISYMNLESNLSHTENINLKEIAESIDLRYVDKLNLIRLPHPSIDSPKKIIKLEEFWFSILDTCNMKKEKIAFNNFGEY